MFSTLKVAEQTDSDPPPTPAPNPRGQRRFPDLDLPSVAFGQLERRNLKRKSNVRFFLVCCSMS